MKDKGLDLVKKLFIITPGLKTTDISSAFNFKSKISANISFYEQNRLFFGGGNGKVNFLAVIVWLVLGILTMKWGMGWLSFIIWMAEVLLIFIGLRRNISASKQDVLRNISLYVDAVKQEGLNSLGLDIAEVNVAIEPLSIVEYYFGDIVSPYKNRENISSNIIVTYFYAGLHQLYMYSKKCSIINEPENMVVSEEFFYRDIVSASIKTDVNDSSAITFEVKLCNGDIKEYRFPNETEITQSLIAIKNLIRDKRNNRC